MFSTPLFGAVCFFDETDEIKFGFVISKKISKRAVDRNKIKRRVKNIIDNNKKVVHNGYDYVIIIKKGILELTYKEMEKELLKLISIGDKIE